MHLTAQQIKKLDTLAIKTYGVPSLALMENAGRAVGEEVYRKLRNAKKKVCVVCGLGNNAGDGFVIARHLINKGCSTQVILIGSGSKLKNDAYINYKVLKKLKEPIYETKKITSKAKKIISSSSIVVDAIFGVGLNRTIKEPFSSFIEYINEVSQYTLSVDVPSGLDATNGSIYGVCIKARTTVTFTFEKSGFIKKDGPKYAGRIKVVDIGIPRKLYKKIK